jgi:hypothetical protein
MCERAACVQTWPAGPSYRDRVASLRITVPQCTQGRPGDSSEEPPGRGVKMVRITGSPILAKPLSSLTRSSRNVSVFPGVWSPGPPGWHSQTQSPWQTSRLKAACR